MFTKVKKYIKKVFERNRFIVSYKNVTSLQSKLYMQLMVAGAFFVLTIVNLISRSYTMLALTAVGSVVNLVFFLIAKKLKNGKICALSSIATCSVLFGSFVIYGGNEGFASLWIILLPVLAMVAMDFTIGFLTGVFFQVFLIVVFWTPVRDMLLYQYNQEFCRRFPLLFLVTFLLGLLLALSLQKSEYNEYKNSIKLQEMTDTARALARTDSLTQLSNRRFAYEEFDSKYAAEGVTHCVVMGDIDFFKKINDEYGHKFGDEVLVKVASYINEFLPQDYLKSRWGGEEFLFAANDTIDKVYVNIENLRKAIAAHVFDCNGTPVQITITFGIAEYYGKSELTKAISTADYRLYYGKSNNKNCTITDVQSDNEQLEIEITESNK